ncbi:MAG: nuclear transport factor 2 family protein [Fuerstiella sp.]
MSVEQNVRKLRMGYAAWSVSKGEAIDYWISLIGENIRWSSVVDESSPGMGFAVDCRSKDEVQSYFNNLGAIWEMVFFDFEETVAQDDRVIVFANCKWKNRVTGKSVETKKIDAFRFKDGKIIEFQEFFDTAKAIAASTPDDGQQ